MQDDDGEATRSRPPEAMSTAPRLFEVRPGTEVSDEPEIYRVEAQIGAGGMGQVLAARGERLGRAVAVKVISADREDLRRRFESEARVTARLQHPGIVPVYGMGRDREGRPFYAMKHVTGRPLDRLIAEATTLAQRLALLPNVLAVAEAIAFAHSEGVIHRDLKPANILVGAFGETVVIDWGLAKSRGVEDEAADAGPFRATADATAHGKVMGTPAYMAPEQARGEAVDQRADVYALGAILYHVLAGAPPHAHPGEGSVPWDSMLARVIASEPPPLETRQPGLPPDLLAIVSRAMNRAPADRFASAAELADDLRRFQTGQLVGAHRYSTRELVWRWFRRHRTPVLVGVVGLVLLAAVGVISVLRIVREQHVAEEARARAEHQRDEAEGLTSFMIFELKDKLQERGSLELAKTVVNRAKTFYERQPEPRTMDERMSRIGVMNALGDIMTSSGNSTGALEQYVGVVAVLEELMTFAPESQILRRNLAAVRRGIGKNLLDQHDTAGALREYQQALDLSTWLAKERPKDTSQLDGLDEARAGIIATLLEAGKPDEALAQARLRLATVEQRRAASPTDRGLMGIELWATMEVGDCAMAHDPKTALSSYRAALDLAKTLAAAAPNDLFTLDNVADAYERVGAALSSQGDYAGALDAFRADLPIAARVADFDPMNAENKKSLANAHARIGDNLRSLRRQREALAEYRTAGDLLEALIELDPKNVSWLGDRVVNHENVGEALLDLGDAHAAADAYRRALEITDRLVAAQPDVAQWVFYRSVIRGDLGDTLAQTGDAAHATEQYRAWILDGETLIKRDPDNLDWRNSLANAHVSLCKTLIAGRTFSEAVTECQAGVTQDRELLVHAPGNVRVEDALAASLQQLAIAHLGAGQVPAALATSRESTEIMDRILAADPTSPRLREVLYNVEMTYGDALIATHQPEEARKVLSRALELSTELAKEEPDRKDIPPDITIIRRDLAKLGAR